MTRPPVSHFSLPADLPVDADGTQVQDARCAHHDIQGDKDVTVNLAEFPLTHHLGTEPNTE